MKTRNELISQAKELNLTFERPINQVKSIVIEEAIASALSKVEGAIVEEIKEEMPIEAFVNIGVVDKKSSIVPKEPRVKISDKIIELAKTGMTRTAIYNELKTVHVKLNYRYVVQTLLKEKISVPRQVSSRVKKTTVEQTEATVE
jgi:hypothetical protein